MFYAFGFVVEIVLVFCLVGVAVGSVTCGSDMENEATVNGVSIPTIENGSVVDKDSITRDIMESLVSVKIVL